MLYVQVTWIFHFLHKYHGMSYSSCCRLPNAWQPTRPSVCNTKQFKAKKLIGLLLHDEKCFGRAAEISYSNNSPQDELIDLERYTGAISDIFTQEIRRNSPVQFYISRNEKLINVLNYWNWSINISSHFLPCWLICRKHWEKWLRFSGECNWIPIIVKENKRSYMGW